MSNSPEGRRRFYDLEALGLLDGPAEPAFDTVVDLTARVLSAPMTVLKIVDHRHDTMRIRAARGFALEDGPVTGGAMSLLCRRIQSGERVVAVADVAREGGSIPIGTLSDLGVASFLGAPLYGPDDEPAGALFAMDRTPRIWSSEERGLIVQLAALATQRIILRAALETVRIIARTNTA